MVLSRAIANNIYTICGTPSLERRYPASRNGGFTAQESSLGGAGPFEKTKSGGGNVKILLPGTELQAFIWQLEFAK